MEQETEAEEKGRGGATAEIRIRKTQHMTASRYSVTDKQTDRHNKSQIKVGYTDGPTDNHKKYTDRKSTLKKINSQIKRKIYRQIDKKEPCYIKQPDQKKDIQGDQQTEKKQEIIQTYKQKQKYNRYKGR